MQNTPPAWLDALVKRFLPSELYEELLGDLYEQFAFQVEELGAQKARWMYFFEVIRFCRPYFLKRRFLADSKYSTSYTYSPAMIRNYFKIAFRNLLKYKGYSFINIFGLATGMAVAMLIGLWVWDELSFNKNFKNHDRIGRIMVHNGEGTYMTNPIPLAAELRASYGSDFKYIAMTTSTQKYAILSGDKKFFQSGSFMQPDAPELFGLDMVYGTRAGLKDPHSILLSESLAKKLFGDENPLDKIVKIKNRMEAKVAGVYKDLPKNSEFQDLTFIGPWDLLASFMTFMKEQENDWNDNSYKIYVQLAPNVDFAGVSAKIKDIKRKHLDAKRVAYNPELFVHPMCQWHLYSKFANRKSVMSDQLEFIWLYGIIGVFVLLLACINFTNLSTARSEKRAKEVGIRKSMGSLRQQLIAQFFGESFLVVFIALGFALLLVQLALPFFNELADKEITILWLNPVFWLSVLGFSVFTGLLAGSYPAFYLSSFQPIKVLKGIGFPSSRWRRGAFAPTPRKILVVIQFTVSIVLIIGTSVVYLQIQHAKNRNVGYDKEGLMAVYMITPDLYQNYEVIKNELLQSGAVTNLAISSSPITDVWENQSGFEWKGKAPGFEDNFATFRVTHDYSKIVGWRFREGRDFSKKFSTDSSAIVINETAVKYMGLKNPINETVKWNGKSYEVIGVIKDIVMGSPFEPILPTVFLLDYNNQYTINIKLNQTMATSTAVGKIAEVFQKYNPAVPFDYKFVDEEYAKKFANEERLGKIASIFAILAIFISCLGLFGLASFVAEQRTKEMGVRKVLGATTANLWGLLSKDFVVLVVLSLFIASPIAYYFMGQWLQKYTYHTEISWWVFALTGAGALLITLLTVSFQTIKAALMNPVKSLKSE
ncbi:ABC transporter permease [Runella limosa]|uniref:ABC transporter permease n=1 Tax=Runella limosa TaxID=370978 RepID=UPI00041D7C49|nr:ABC transporter permease [Runella limosa]